jgi:hypothetical protein
METSIRMLNNKVVLSDGKKSIISFGGFRFTKVNAEKLVKYAKENRIADFSSIPLRVVKPLSCYNATSIGEKVVVLNHALKVCDGSKEFRVVVSSASDEDKSMAKALSLMSETDRKMILSTMPETRQSIMMVLMNPPSDEDIAELRDIFFSIVDDMETIRTTYSLRRKVERSKKEEEATTPLPATEEKVTLRSGKKIVKKSTKA